VIHGELEQSQFDGLPGCGTKTLWYLALMNKSHERKCLDGLLAQLSELSGYAPGSIASSEKPDFIIDNAGTKIGVEVTLAVSQERIRATKLHAVEFRSSWLGTTHLKDRNPRRSNDELRKSMGHIGNLSLTTPWKKVSDAMLEWRQRIANALKRKRMSYNHPDYQIFDQNWLLIHDYQEWITEDLAIAHLAQIFGQVSGVERDFETVFIQSGEYLFRWHQQTLYRAQ
jgi:hypothetical protein